ncbi:hypothetical protein [Streptomyces javensis]|uniref:hypothetical protein n=1 Tax=Streptomyces javensis TaxID=114698 RepID=UPI0031F7B08F
MHGIGPVEPPDGTDVFLTGLVIPGHRGDHGSGLRYLPPARREVVPGSQILAEPFTETLAQSIAEPLAQPIAETLAEPLVETGILAGQGGSSGHQRMFGQLRVDRADFGFGKVQSARDLTDVE